MERQRQIYPKTFMETRVRCRSHSPSWWMRDRTVSEGLGYFTTDWSGSNAEQNVPTILIIDAERGPPVQVHEPEHHRSASPGIPGAGGGPDEGDRGTLSTLVGLPGSGHLGAMDRRGFFRVAAAGSALLGTGCFRRPTTYLEVAEAAGAWIRAQGRVTPHGTTWLAAPSQSPEDVYHLYSGTPGVILFLLELHHATGEDQYLRDAESGARHLAALAAQELGTSTLPDWGLYTGLAGVVYTLAEVHRAGGDDQIGDAADALSLRLME